MPISFWIAVGAIILLQVGLTLWRNSPASEEPEPVEAPQTSVEVRLAALELTVAGLPSLWESERTRAEAAANSARTARARAERLVKQRLELEDADDDVRDDDGDAGQIERVPAVPQNVGAPPIPDDYAAQMRRNALFNLSPL